MERLLGNTIQELEVTHNCALAGVAAKSPDILQKTIVNGLVAQQHRGQEAVGLVWSDGRHLKQVKNMGLVSGFFTSEVISNFKPISLGIGHTRYSTVDKQKDERKNIQPFIFSDFAIGHNGTVYIEGAAKKDEPTSDTYRVGKAIHFARGSNFEQKAVQVLSHLQGAYTFLFITKDALYVARDPAGFRPCLLGALEGDNGYAVASESIGLEKMHAKLLGEIDRGTLVKITPTEKKLVWSDPRAENMPEAACSFEHSYFADASSTARKDITNHSVRVMLGHRVAQKARPQGDYVVAVPNSGRSYAEGVEHELGLPTAQAIQVNRFTNRNFIKPQTPKERMQEAFYKYSFIPELIKGKKLLVVEDSIVRGHTTQGLTLALFHLGAERIDFLVGIPPITDPCYWGIDFRHENELIYHQLMSNEEEAGSFEERLGRWLVGYNPDLEKRLRVSYQDLENYVSIIQGVPSGTPIHESGGCFHCVSGVAPQGVITPVEIGRKMR